MISVIIPVYNQADFVDETLSSVFNQTFQDWECIIVNDGSTDLSEEKILKWTNKDVRFKYFKRENGGLASARNFGIAKATNEILFPLDSDDIIKNNLLFEVNKAFEKDKNIELVYFDVEFFGVKSGLYSLPKYTFKKLLTQNCFIACSAFKKSGWEKSGGYDENLKSFEDWDFWIRMLHSNSKVYKINQVLYSYRKHKTDSLTNNFSVNPNEYYQLYDYIYVKNKNIYDTYFKTPILVFHENELLQEFNSKVKNMFIFKIYQKIKKIL